MVNLVNQKIEDFLAKNPKNCEQIKSALLFFKIMYKGDTFKIRKMLSAKKNLLKRGYTLRSLFIEKCSSIVFDRNKKKSMLSFFFYDNIISVASEISTRGNETALFKIHKFLISIEKLKEYCV